MAQTVVKKIGEDILVVDEPGTQPPPPGDCECKVEAGLTTTLAAGSAATVSKRYDPLTKTNYFDFGIPQGLKGDKGDKGDQGTGSGTGGTNYNFLNNYFNIKEYNAVGNGTNDDRQAIQNAINATISSKGKLIIPQAPNYWRINDTLRFEPTSANQSFFDVEGQGHWERQIVYQGLDNKPAVIIDGMKGGSFTRFLLKIGDNVDGCAGIDIGTRVGGSTAGFSFNDCTVTLNRGIGNQGWRLGEIPSNIGEDIAQLAFINCKAEGWSAGGTNLYAGQIGFNITGRNTLALTWVGGSCIFTETSVKVEQGGSLFFNGFQTSHVGTCYWMQWANILTIDGGRSEHDRKFLLVDQMSASPIVTINGVMIEDAYAPDGNLIDFRAPGTLKLDGVSMNRINSTDYDSRLIKLSTPASHPFGSFKMEGGRVSASDPFYTAQGWRVKIEDVIRVKPTDVTPVGYFTNRS